MRKKQEETYSITPKGLIMLEVESEKSSEAILNSLELYARRNNYNAIYFDAEKGPLFIHVVLEK